LLWNGYFLLINKGIPNIPTTAAIRKSMIDIIKQDMAQTEAAPYTIIDLGSGSGRTSRHIAKSIPNAHVIGIEISTLAYWQSVLIQKLTRTKNLTYKRANFHDTDISEANAIVMFLLGTLMKSIREKLESDLKDNTLVISNKFKVGGHWTPQKTLDIKTFAPHQKTLFIYKKQTQNP